MGEDRAQSDEPAAYSSPQAVYDAYRRAQDKHDWRTAFCCLTPHGKDIAMLEGFMICTLHRSDERVEAILKKHAIEFAAVEADLQRLTKQKDVDGGEVADKQGDGAPAGLDLLREILAARINDPAGFVDATQQAFHSAAVQAFERLENVTIEGNQASGLAVFLRLHQRRRCALRRSMGLG